MTENDNDKDKPKDNVVIFPLHKRLRKDKTGPDPEAARRIKLEQTKEFVEGSIDDIGIELLFSFSANFLSISFVGFVIQEKDTLLINSPNAVEAVVPLFFVVILLLFSNKSIGPL